MLDYRILIDELNRVRDLYFTKSEKDNQYDGKIKLKNDRIVDISIIFPSSFPLQIPVFYVKTDHLEFLHTNKSGKMCLFDENAILLKQNDPLGILVECFDKAYDILNISSDSERYKQEIKREFDSYWQLFSKLQIYSCIDTKQIVFSEGVLACLGKTCVLADSEDDCKYLLYNYFDESDSAVFHSNKCLLVRLRENSDLPKMGDVKWKDVKNYITDNVSSSQKRRFRMYCNARILIDTKIIVLILPNDKGDILFGYKIGIRNKRYTKFARCVNAKINPIHIERIDEEYLLERAGADSVVHNKRVLLLGCGSIGGFIADNLCAAGIGCLDLLDNDDFKTENVHRHFLGMNSALKGTIHNKADLLKAKLEDRYLYTKIDSLNFIDRAAETFIADTKRLERYDLIVSALGEPTINLEISRILYEKGINIPFVVCFNEPYGIGGHVIVSNITKDTCLRCLYTDLISSDLVEYIGSFVEKQQSFKKNISGCGSAFVPYSRLDSQQTAIISTRAIIDVFKGNITQNTVRSWVGYSDQLKAAGKKESKYYLKQVPGNEIEKIIKKNDKCPVCGVKHGDI